MTPKVYISNLEHIRLAVPEYARKHLLIKTGVMLVASIVASVAAGYAYDRKVTFVGYEDIFWEND